MEMPRPSIEQQALNILVGDWLGQEKIHPSPFDTVGGPAIGRVHNRLALDGFAVIQDYEQERKGAVNFRGHGIFRWDGSEKVYMLDWFDSFGLPPVAFRGTLENRILSLTAPQPPGFARAVFDFSKDAIYQYRQEGSIDRKQWSVLMEGEYKRQ